MRPSHEKTFPMPFSAINRSIHFKTRAMLKFALAHFVYASKETGGIFYAVDPKTCTLYTTVTGVAYFSKIIEKHKLQVSYYNEMTPRA